MVSKNRYVSSKRFLTSMVKAFTSEQAKYGNRIYILLMERKRYSAVIQGGRKGVDLHPPRQLRVYEEEKFWLICRKFHSAADEVVQ